MENFERFIGKNVKITVAFGGIIHQGGSIPLNFIGTLERIENDFLEFSDVKKETFNFTSTSYNNYSNYAIVNKQYILMMAEL